MLFDRDYMSPQRRGWFSPQGSVLMPLIWMNVIVYLLQLFTNNGITNILALTVPGLRDFEIWRLGTYMFTHSTSSVFHILFNMWGLYLFGSQLEQTIGPHRFLNLYFLSGILGGLLWVLLNWKTPSGMFVQSPMLVGASGSVMGIVMATAMLYPDQMIMLLFPPIPMKMKTFMFIFGGLELVMAFQQGGRIAHIAHLGGFLGGYLFIRRFYRPRWTPFQGLHNGFMEMNRQRKQRNRFRDWEIWNNDEDNDGPSNHEIDRILDKIGSHGLDSLTPEEKKTLEQARHRLRRR